LVAHIGVPNPFSPEFSQIISQAIAEVGGDVHDGGTFITIEGPRFSTKGETHVYRQWGMDIIGMTTSPEAFLALEAEIAYACMAHITDYDVWHEDAEPVTAEQVFRIVNKNTTLAQSAILHLVKTMDEWAGEFEAHHHLHNALSTDPSLVPAELKAKLKPLVAKYLD
jgi:5'-methylthioadenosine phosphorylase